MRQRPRSCRRSARQSCRSARAVAPIDGRREVARRCIRIGVGEGGHRRAVDRSPFCTDDGRAACREHCVRDRRRVGGRYRDATDVIDAHVNRVFSFVSVGVHAVDRKTAAALRDHVPVVVAPSPQLMVAVKSLAVALGSHQ